MKPKIYLVCSVRAKNIQRGCDKLGFNGHCLSALLLAYTQRLLDGVDPRRSVACEFDISTQLDGLRSQTSGNSGFEKCKNGRGSRVL